MTAIIGLASGIMSGFIVAIITFFSTRYSLLHSYDQSLREQRLERYRELFHLSKCFPRYLLVSDPPSRSDLLRVRLDFFDWYYSKNAGGMFLTEAAKHYYIMLQDSLADGAFKDGKLREDGLLSAEEMENFSQLAILLRNQLAADVGAADPPRHRWTSPAAPVDPSSRVLLFPSELGERCTSSHVL
jgi:hypothetical protein